MAPYPLCGFFFSVQNNSVFVYAVSCYFKKFTLMYFIFFKHPALSSQPCSSIVRPEKVIRKQWCLKQTAAKPIHQETQSYTCSEETLDVKTANHHSRLRFCNFCSHRFCINVGAGMRNCQRNTNLEGGSAKLQVNIISRGLHVQQDST